MILRDFEMYTTSGLPVPGATVNLYAASLNQPSGGTILQTTTTNAQGMWEFTGLADGDYDVEVVAGTGHHWRKGYSRVSSTAIELPTQMTQNLRANPIINGGFEIWQRGTSFPNLAADTYSADRWVTSFSSSVGLQLLTVTQDGSSLPPVTAMVPTMTSALKITPGASGPDTSLGGNEYCYLAQKIEGYTWAPFLEKPFTVGFWVRSHLPGTYSLTLQVGGSACVKTYQIVGVDTWEYQSLTFPATPAGAFGSKTNGIGAYLILALAGVGVYATSTLNNWAVGSPLASTTQVNGINTGFDFRIWGVTLGLGPNVQPYWPRPYSLELALCQRYYELFSGNSSGYPLASQYAAGAGLLVPLHILYKEVKRIVPAVSVTGTWNIGTNTTGQPVASYVGVDGVTVLCTSAGAGVVQYFADSAGDNVTINAEL